MDTIIKAIANELNNSLIDFIKSNFKNKKITVHIYEDEIDETEYLLSDPVHRKELLASVEEVNKTKNFKSFSIEEIENILNEPEQ